MDEGNNIKLSKNEVNVQIFVEEARVTDTIKSIQLCNKKLRIEMNLNAVDAKRTGICEEANNDDILGLIVGGETKEDTTFLQ